MALVLHGFTTLVTISQIIMDYGNGPTIPTVCDHILEPCRAQLVLVTALISK